MNFFRLIFLTITNNTTAAVRMGRDALTHTLRLLQLAIVVPGIMLIIGIVADWRGLIAFSGLLNVVMLMLFTLWADILAHIVVLSSNLGHSVWAKVPDIERQSAQRFIRWLRGITLWISIVWFYAMTFPVRENVGMFLMALTAALILAGIASARQWNGKLFWMTYSLWAIMMVAYCTISLASPATAERIRGAAAFQIAKLTNVNLREEKLAEVSKHADEEAQLHDQNLLKKLLDERNELRWKAIKDCDGNFCSPDDAKRHAELEVRITELKKGNYWKPDGSKQEAADLPPAPEGQVDSSGDNAATLPPPPVERVETSPSKGKGGSKPSDPKNAGVYDELAKYGM